jgi:hypothetical protein
LMDLSRVEVEAKGTSHYIDIHNRRYLWIASSFERSANNWVVCLLLEMNTVMDMTFLQDPKKCMAILMNMERIRTLWNSPVTAFGQCYLYPFVSLRPPPFHVFSIHAPIFFILMLHLVSPCAN